MFFTSSNNFLVFLTLCSKNKSYIITYIKNKIMKVSINKHQIKKLIKGTKYY